jgi:hypothetical protein
VPSLSPARQAALRGLDTRLEPGIWRSITFDDRAVSAAYLSFADRPGLR